MKEYEVALKCVPVQDSSPPGSVLFGPRSLGSHLVRDDDGSRDDRGSASLLGLLLVAE